MRLFFTYLLAAAATMALTAGCASRRANVPPTEEPASGGNQQEGQLKIDVNNLRPSLSHGPVAVMPKAIIYKTSGDFRQNVPVQVNADGTLLSYPAPSDIPENAAPVQLESGWLLSPVGVGPQTVFTTYTYDEYRSLSQPPAPEEILKAVIPGSRVTTTMEVPMTLGEALADPAAVDRYLSSTATRQ